MKRKPLHWFALDESQPLFFFGGIGTPRQGTRGTMKSPRLGERQLFAFLTCEPNGVVKPIHPKVMPVILTTEDKIEMWMTAEWSQAQVLQRPLADDALMVLPPDAPLSHRAAHVTVMVQPMNIATNNINSHLDTLLN